MSNKAWDLISYNQSAEVQYTSHIHEEDIMEQVLFSECVTVVSNDGEMLYYHQPTNTYFDKKFRVVSVDPNPIHPN